MGKYYEIIVGSLRMRLEKMGKMYPLISLCEKKQYLTATATTVKLSLGLFVLKITHPIIIDSDC